MTLAQIQPLARLLISSAMVFGVLAAVAGVSSALFSDSATIENSTFATGDVDLQIAHDEASPGIYSDSITGPSVSGMIPGDEETFDFWLKNNSDSAEVSLDLSALLKNINASDPAMEADLSIGFACDVGNDGVSTEDGEITSRSLDAWQADGAVAGLGTLGPNDGTVDGVGTDEAKCTMTATLSETSEASGETVNFDAEFIGENSAPEPEIVE